MTYKCFKNFTRLPLGSRKYLINKDRGFKCSHVAFEIGSRGYINNRNKLALGGLLRRVKSKTKFATFYKNISKISLLCSFAIYCARNEPEWTTPRLLSP